MGRRFQRILALAIALVAAGEVLLLNWLSLARHGEALSLPAWGIALAAAVAVNAAVFPQARARVRATGVARHLSRAWILGSVAALLTGLLLAGVFLVFGGGLWLLGADSAGRLASVWLGGIAVALGFGSVLWGSSVGSWRVQVDRIRLPAPHLTPELRALRIAHVTDLHIGPLMQPPMLRRFVARINDLEPDLIVITGDIFDFDPEYVTEGCRELGRLRARLGSFAVLGNHDVYTGADRVAAGIAELTPIRLLRDEWAVVETGGTPLAIAGLEDPGEGWAQPLAESPALEKLAAGIPGDRPCLLLAHRPSFFRHAAELGFPLVLSGHTHGGQVAVPGAHHHNPSRLIAHWTRGVFSMGSSTLYVNRGLGMAGLPLRINCPREIALLQLSDGAAPAATGA